MTNLEYYKEEIKNGGSICGVYKAYCGKSYHYYDVIDWLCEEHKEPLLNDDEKEYFYQVQEALDIDIDSICKVNDTNINYEYIEIIYHTELKHNVLIKTPCYKKNERFTNLEIDKEYTAEELGL